MSALREWLMRADLPGGRACDDALEWLATPGASLETCDRGEWLLWVAARLGYGPSECTAAVRPAVLRSLRVYAPSALDSAGMDEHAAVLRALPEECDMVKASAAAWEAYRAARATRATSVRAARAARAAESASRAARAWARANESALPAVSASKWVASSAAWAADRDEAACAADVRAAMPDLGAWLAAAVAS